MPDKSRWREQSMLAGVYLTVIPYFLNRKTFLMRSSGKNSVCDLSYSCWLYRDNMMVVEKISFLIICSNAQKTST